MRAMIDLAEEYGKGPVMMGDISERQGFSRKYLHALLTSLKTAGLVESTRGARGGYMLAKAPEEIPVLEIFEALEGAVAIVNCVGDGEHCVRMDGCKAKEMWDDINDAISLVLKSRNLGDLL